MLDTLSRSIEWQSHHHTSTRPDHNNRFLDEGLGCNMQRCDNTRSVEHPGTERTHKCIGIESSNVCTESICQNRPNKLCAFTSGQHHNSCTDQQDGGNAIPKAFYDNSRIMAVLHIIADHSDCRTSSGSPKRDCGQGVESFSRSECMETIEYNTSANRTGIGHDNVDLFADRLTTQKSRYISWRPDLGAMAIDAFSVKWNAINAYAFPPFCLIGRCLAKVRKDQADLLIITPVWPAQPWYPILLGMLIEPPILLPPIPNFLTSP